MCPNGAGNIVFKSTRRCLTQQTIFSITIDTPEENYIIASKVISQ